MAVGYQLSAFSYEKKVAIGSSQLANYTFI